MTTFLSRAAVLGAALSFSGGCLGSKDCTLEARGSVNLSVVDLGGAAIDGATATYTVDGGEPSDCEGMTGGTFVCGWEVAGVFAITASAPGFGTLTEEITVDSDECHVIPESLTIPLDTIACTDQAVPSMIATVVGSSGEVLTGVAVSWGIDPLVLESCTPLADQWICGEEVAGTLTVQATADGHETVTETVEVGADECHVLTEQVDFSLNWLAD